ncbi:four helix bundle protein [Chitinophaga solisilvae]|uniref:Four helix bundle protein n=1 Tax=Chitinophaga solisilvae TaxID=1233460 RepID=A0A3S1AZ85_9BACT|nr:four helix bundle protein [Chitinophaga solisilvae]NSL88853.1 four helix bundle protein [Chitinophaga solisilvae]
MKPNVILEKSFAFSVRIVKLITHLDNRNASKTLTRQLLRSGTSIGANTEEAVGASTTRDFKYKIDISYREARETIYWLKLLKETQQLESGLAQSFISDCQELIKILGAIQKTLKSRSA